MKNSQTFSVMYKVNRRAQYAQIKHCFDFLAKLTNINVYLMWQRKYRINI